MQAHDVGISLKTKTRHTAFTERQGVRVIPTEDLESLVGGGLAAEEARFAFRLLGPSETHGRDMQGKGLPLPGGARSQTMGT